jgi:hypothetical protein
MEPTPLTGSGQPGLKRYDVENNVVSTSPAAITLQLPEQGIYLGTFSAWFGTQNDRAIAVAVVKWYSYSSGFVLGTDILGGVDLLAQATGLTLSDPTTAGVITATVSSTRGNSEVRCAMNLRLLSSVADQYAI